MATIHCKACGAAYHYEKEGCCPNCGAYNRPPKRERVNADGTVQHMTDAAYEKRQHDRGKVCFEKKECFEDQARQGKGRIQEAIAAAVPRSNSKGKTNPAQSLIGVIIAIMIASGMFSGLFDRLTGENAEPEDYTGPTYVEPVEIEPVAPDDENPVEDEYAAMTEEVTMEDGTTFIVWAWEQHDEERELYLLLETSFAEDSDHGYDAALMCTDASGEEETLVDYTTTWDEDGYLQLHFPTDRYDELYPDFLELQEWDGDNLVLSRFIDLR